MINFVYFDVGGVVIKDFSGTNKWNELRDEIGITPTNRSKFDEIWSAHKDTHSTTYDVDNLVPILNEELNLSMPENYSLLMGFVNRFEKNQDIWSTILEIQRQVPIGLLTNMYPRMFGKIRAAGLLPPIYWDVIVDSSVELLKKPDPEFFKLAEKRVDANPNEILFVDNSQKHLNAAAKCGWQTFLYNPQNSNEDSRALLDYFNSKRLL